MGRLANKLVRARNAMDELEHAVGQDVDKFVERVGHVHRRREDLFMRQHAALDADVSDLAEMEKDLEDFGKNDRSGDGETSGSAYVGTAPKS